MNTQLTNSYPSPPTLNLQQRQIMLSFAYLAYTGEGFVTPNPETTILNNINAAIPQIQPLASGWKVVWGPAVYTVPGSLYQDNMMYVARSVADPSQFVIAIRGTNFTSSVDWLLEDFNVIQLMNWPINSTATNPAGAAISESSSVDLNTVLKMVDLNSTPNLSLLEFLSSVSTKPINICVTGHSLGGVLASTLALYLLDNQASGSWDSSGKSTVTCITFAAPTAGNAQFAAHSDATFAAANVSNPPSASMWDTNLKTNCDIIESAYDIAPQFFSTQTLTNLFQTYGSNINFGSLSGTDMEEYVAFLLIFSKLISLTSAQNFTQLSVTNSGGQIPGVFNGTPPATPSFTGYLEAFVEQAAWQHSNSYPYIFGLDASLLNPAIIVRSLPGFQVQGISPSSGHRSSSYPVTITGSGFSSMQNLTLSSTSDITITNVTIVNDTQITANFQVTGGMGDQPIVISGSSGMGFFVNNELEFYVDIFKGAGAELEATA